MGGHPQCLGRGSCRALPSRWGLEAVESLKLPSILNLTSFLYYKKKKKYPWELRQATGAVCQGHPPSIIRPGGEAGLGCLETMPFPSQSM
jgi:hypothetical protein